MKKKSHFSIKRVLKAISLLFALLVVGLLIVLCIHQYFGSGSLTSSEIMSFFGGYLGVSLSIMITMMRAEEDDKRYEEQQKIDESRHVDTLKQISEQKRLDLLPMLEVDSSQIDWTVYPEVCVLDFHDDYGFFEIYNYTKQEIDEELDKDETLLSINLKLKNIGLGGAINVSFSSDSQTTKFSIRRNEEVPVVVIISTENINIKELTTADNSTVNEFDLYFQDLIGTCYYQHVEFKVNCLFKSDSNMLTSPYISASTTCPPSLINPSYKTDPSTHQPSEVIL